MHERLHRGGCGAWKIVRRLRFVRGCPHAAALLPEAARKGTGDLRPAPRRRELHGRGRLGQVADRLDGLRLLPRRQGRLGWRIAVGHRREPDLARHDLRLRPGPVCRPRRFVGPGRVRRGRQPRVRPYGDRHPDHRHRAHAALRRCRARTARHLRGSVARGGSVWGTDLRQQRAPRDGLHGRGGDRAGRAGRVRERDGSLRVRARVRLQEPRGATQPRPAARNALASRRVAERGCDRGWLRLRHDPRRLVPGHSTRHARVCAREGEDLSNYGAARCGAPDRQLPVRLRRATRTGKRAPECSPAQRSSPSAALARPRRWLSRARCSH